MGQLTGKTILVTGAGRGQGRAYALAAAREGADIIAIDVAAPIMEVRYPLASADDLADTAKSIEELNRRVVSEAVDVRDSAALDAIVARGLDEFGAIDGVVANAGVLDWDCRFWEITDVMWSTVIDINLTGVWRTLRAVAPSMIAARAGSLVVVASINSFEPAFDYAGYVTAKHGLLGLMRNAALELAEHNIRCNAVCPGAIDTRIWNNDMGYAKFSPNGPRTRAAAIDAAYTFPALAGRSALPPEAVSSAACWLLSGQSEHVTGIALPVDGGHLIQPGWNMAPMREGAEAERYRPPQDVPHNARMVAMASSNRATGLDQSTP